jgi:hypothetical protein
MSFVPSHERQSSWQRRIATYLSRKRDRQWILRQVASRVVCVLEGEASTSRRSTECGTDDERDAPGIDVPRA